MLAGHIKELFGRHGQVLGRATSRVAAEGFLWMCGFDGAERDWLTESQKGEG